MTKKQKALQWMLNLAADNSHGYDQAYRWGEKGDYDCSSAIIQAWQEAGVPVKTNGATYTGNMRSVFLKSGFKDVTNKVNLNTGAGLEPSDVLLNQANHTAMYAGNGQEVEASINEYGGITGGKPGDQTGREILVKAYRNYPWDCVLRYEGESAPEPEVPSGRCGTCTVKLGEFIGGAEDPEIKTIQKLLNWRGYRGKTGQRLKVDGVLGENTQYAITKMQKKAGLKNINYGTVSSSTWMLLIG